MVETILHAWHSIPFIFRVPMEFWLSIIIIRGIVAKDITTWLEDRGFIKKKEQSVIYRSLDFVYLHLKDILPNPERKTAIWDHFKLGHEAHLSECSQGHCTSL